MMTSIRLSRADIESLPHYRKKTATEFSAACPNCNAGEDRFLFWPEVGNYYCRQCEIKGFVLDVSQAQLTDAQREAWQRAEERRRQKEAELEAAILSDVSLMGPLVEQYHQQLARANGYWQKCGLMPDTIARYQLGYCPSCPRYPDSGSYVIPVYHSHSLVCIRHRLERPPVVDGKCRYKYLYHLPGMKAQLFNVDTLEGTADEVHFGILEQGETLLVEGEIKTMFLDQSGFSTIGVPGASVWKDEWGAFLQGVSRIFVVFDPGAGQMAMRTARKIADIVGQVYVVSLPSKPDDFFVLDGGTIDEFLGFLRWGRLVK